MGSRTERTGREGAVNRLAVRRFSNHQEPINRLWTMAETVALSRRADERADDWIQVAPTFTGSVQMAGFRGDIEDLTWHLKVGGIVWIHRLGADGRIPW